MPRKKRNQQDDAVGEGEMQASRSRRGLHFYREDMDQGVAQISLDNGKIRQRYREICGEKAVRQSLYAVYRGLINKHILPELGHLKLQCLSTQQVEAFYTRKLDGGVARIIRQMHSIPH